MKFLQTAVDQNFAKTMEIWTRELSGRTRSALLHIYVPYNRESAWEEVRKLREILKEKFPEVPVIGCSATGGIIDGRMDSNEVAVTLTVLEDAHNQAEVFAYCAKDRTLEDARGLLTYLQKIPDLKGIEVLTSADYERLESVGRIIDELPEEVQIFGGVAVGDNAHPSYVFVNECELVRNGTVFVFYSGETLAIKTSRMFGWNPIGYPLEVTRSEGPVVYELDGMPAYDVYNHYLQIPKDEQFFYSALEFPWEVEVNHEMKYIRHAKAVNEDGSILMSSDIPKGSRIRISYGDPRRIIRSTRQAEQEILEFAPDIVQIYNCMGRMFFWGQQADVEIADMAKYIKTTGFSALGEIMRHNKITLLNNLSIVAVSMREGEAISEKGVDVLTFTDETNMPITARLAIFINTITDELMEKNRQLNEMLYRSTHDFLTGLLNRGAMEHEIYETYERSVENPGNTWHLIMMDIDDFKRINDQHGHSEGDRILQFLSEFLKKKTEMLRQAKVGRWGGEEFMLLLSDYSDGEAKDIAEQLRKSLEELSENKVNPITVSVGATSHRSGENVSATLSRVDTLLYQAKKQGKNRVCSDL